MSSSSNNYSCCAWLIIILAGAWIGEHATGYVLQVCFGDDAFAKWTTTSYLLRYAVNIFIFKFTIIAAVICWLLAFGIATPFFG